MIPLEGFSPICSRKTNDEIIRSFIGQEFKDTIVKSNGTRYFYFNNILYRGMVGNPIIVRLETDNHILLLINRVFSKYCSTNIYNYMNGTNYYMNGTNKELAKVYVDYSVFEMLTQLKIVDLKDNNITGITKVKSLLGSQYFYYDDCLYAVLINKNILILDRDFNNTILYRLNKEYDSVHEALQAVTPNINENYIKFGAGFIPEDDLIYDCFTNSQQRLKKYDSNIIPRTHIYAGQIYQANTGQYIIKGRVCPALPSESYYKRSITFHKRHLFLLPDCVDLLTFI